MDKQYFVIISNFNQIYLYLIQESQIKYTYTDPEQAVAISNIFLEMYEKQNARIWNQYMEVKGTSRRKNLHTETL